MISGKTMKPVFLSRQERARRFGIDCGDGLHWRGWEPGGDYPKKLILKNVSKDVLKIKYKLPATKFFYMEFPEVISVSPGMHATVRVQFRPVVPEAYSDCIEFETTRGTFFVPVQASLPTLALDIPDALDFGFCPVNEIAELKFAVRNIGGVPAPYTWKCLKPFQIHPPSGHIPVGLSQSFVCSFAPKDASALEATLTGTFARQSFGIQVNAISKYPYIDVQPREIDFGQVLTEKKVERMVSLHNRSAVRASFVLQNVEQDHDAVYTIRPQSGSIPAGGVQMVKVSYCPKSSGTFTADNFYFLTPSGYRAPLHLKGTATGANVYFEANIMNFGDVALGSKYSNELRIFNSSDTKVAFQFMEDDVSAFRFDRLTGFIPPMLSTVVTVKFAPDTPINFYKRVFCQLSNQAPVYIDLLGTCYSHSIRPCPLEVQHVLDYRRYMGIDPSLRRLTPEACQEELKKREDQNPDFDVYAGPIKEEASWKQYFLDSEDQQAEATIREKSVAFGHCSHLRMSEYKIIHVTNHSNFKMLCCWDIKEPPIGGRSPLFVVFPSEADILPHSTMEFKVSFRPTTENEYYCQQLQCYLYNKRARSFRLVDADNLSPPLNLHTVAFGHTFAPGAVHFLPQAAFSQRKLDFPPCLFGKTKYMNVMLTNSSDTPLSFNFPNDSDGVFTIKPQAGQVKPNQFQILSVKFCPPQAQQPIAHHGLRGPGSVEFAHTFSCIANHGNRPMPLKVWGVGYIPKVEFPHGTQLRFKPTCRGMLSRRKWEMHNRSRAATVFRWVIPPRHKKFLRVIPSHGVIAGNASISLTWEFVPSELKDYNFVVPCFISGADTLDLNPPPIVADPIIVELNMNNKVPQADVASQNDAYSRSFSNSPRTEENKIRERKAKCRATKLADTSGLGKAISNIPDKSDLGITKPVQNLIQPEFDIKGFLKHDLEGLQRPNEQRVLLNLEGECISGVVVFDPPLVDFGATQLYEQASKSFYVINSGDCALGYSLKFQQTVPAIPAADPDVDAGVNALLAINDTKLAENGPINLSKQKESKSQQAKVDAQLGIDSKSAHSTSRSKLSTFSGRLSNYSNADAISPTLDPLDPSTFPLIQFDRPRGVIPARSKLRLTIRLCPRRPVPHQFKIACNVFKAQVSQDGKDAEEEEFELLETANESAVELDVKARGSFPTVTITDARMDNTENSDLLAIWNRLNIDGINQELASDLSPIETSLNAQSPKIKAFKAGTLMKQLANFKVDLDSGELRATPKVACFKVENRGNLPASWSIKFPEDVDVAIEKWADAGVPSKEERWQQAITDRGLFSVLPRKGTLEKGEFTLIRVTYIHKFRGRHELPITLKIEKGHQIVLRLCGETYSIMPPLFTFSHLPTFHSSLPETIDTSRATSALTDFTPDGNDPTVKHYHHDLADIPLGLSVAGVPVQTFALVNNSQWPLTYQLDLAAVDEIRNDNYGVDIFSFVNPVGTVPAGTTRYLRLVFRPLEMQHYSVRIPIQIMGVKKFPTQVVCFHGNGYLPSPERPLHHTGVTLGYGCVSNVATSRALSSFPHHQTMLVPDQLARLSNDMLNFGDIPLLSHSYHLLSITNLSDTRSVYFQWNQLAQAGVYPDADETITISITPSSGKLEPQQFMLLKVAFKAGSRPLIFDRDFRCTVTYRDPSVPVKVIGSDAEGESAAVAISDYASANVSMGPQYWERAGPHSTKTYGGIATKQTTAGRSRARPGFDFYGVDRTIGHRLAKRVSVTASLPRRNLAEALAYSETLKNVDERGITNGHIYQPAATLPPAAYKSQTMKKSPTHTRNSFPPVKSHTATLNLPVPLTPNTTVVSANELGVLIKKETVSKKKKKRKSSARRRSARTRAKEFVAPFSHLEPETMMLSTMNSVSTLMSAPDSKEDVGEERPRDKEILHLRVLARVLTFDLLEAQDSLVSIDDPLPAPILPVGLGLGENVTENDINPSTAVPLIRNPDVYQRYYVEPLKQSQETKEQKYDNQAIDEDLKQGVLDQLIKDVLQDTLVKESFNQLNQAPIPYFVPQPDTVELYPKEESVNVNLIGKENKDSDGISDSTPAPIIELNRELATLTPEQEETLHSTEFKGVCEKLLVETLYNLMHEAAHGEFDVAQLPRLVVKEDSLSFGDWEKYSKQQEEKRAAEVELAKKEAAIKAAAEAASKLQLSPAPPMRGTPSKRPYPRQLRELSDQADVPKEM